MVLTVEEQKQRKYACEKRWRKANPEKVAKYNRENCIKRVVTPEGREKKNAYFQAWRQTPAGKEAHRRHADARNAKARAATVARRLVAAQELLNSDDINMRWEVVDG